MNTTKAFKLTAKSVLSELKTLANPEIATHSQRFFKTGKGEYGEGDRFLGIRVPVLRALVKQYNGLSTEETLQLLTSPLHEVRLFAVLMLNNLFKQGDSKNRKHIYTLYLSNTQYINNWDIIDSSAHLIVGPYLETRSRKPLYKLAKSKDLWERRISMMATFHFIRQNDFDDTLALAAILLNDKEDLIHKVVGWMLREVGNRDLKAEEGFLSDHYKDMPRTMLRYAIEKLPEKRRKAYLNGKV